MCSIISVCLLPSESLTGGMLPPAEFLLESLQAIPRTSAVVVPVHCFYSGQTKLSENKKSSDSSITFKITVLLGILTCTSLSQFLLIDFPTANQTRSTTNAKATQGLVYMSNIYISILKQTGVIKN